MEMIFHSIDDRWLILSNLAVDSVDAKAEKRFIRPAIDD